MTDKFINTIRSNFGVVIAISTLLMLLGVWYYSTKNLPDRVVCLEKTADIHSLTITRHELEIGKVGDKLDKILEQQNRMMMTLGELRGKARTGNE